MADESRIGESIPTRSAFLQPSPQKVLTRRQSLWLRMAHALWGYDFFVSYHWASGGTYAVCLSERLRDLKFDCFLDRAEFAVGDDWEVEADKALRNTQRLVVIATRDAIADSDPVRHELEIFTNRSHRVIPIVFEERFSESERQRLPTLALLPDTQIEIVEESDNLDNGPSKRVLDEIIRAHRLVRRRTIRAAAVVTVFIVLSIASAVALTFWRVAERARSQTEVALIDSQRELARNLIDRGVSRIQENDADTGLFHLLRAYEIAERLTLDEGAKPLSDEEMSSIARRLMAAGSLSVGIGLYHKDEAKDAMFSPDGAIVRTLTVNVDGEPVAWHFWDARTGRPLGKPLRIHDGFFQIAMSRDWKTAVYWNGNAFMHLDVISGRARKVPSKALNPKGESYPVAYSPDGRWYGTTNRAVVELWNTETGELAHAVPSELETIEKMVFSHRSGLLLITSSDTPKLQLIDINAGQTLGKPAVLGSSIVQASFSADGKHFATVDRQNTVQLWAAQPVRQIGLPQARFQDTTRVNFSPEGLTLLIRNGSSIMLVDARTGQSLGEALSHPHPILSASFSADGSKLVTADGSGEADTLGRPIRKNWIRIWDLPTNRLLLQFQGLKEPTVSIRFSPKGDLVLLEGKSSFQLHDSDTGRRRGGPWNPGAGFNQLVFAPNGQAVYAMQQGNRLVRIYQTAVPTTIMQAPEKLTLARLSPDSSHLVTIVKGVIMQSWDIYSGKPVYAPVEHPKRVEEIYFSPDGEWILTEDDRGGVRIWNGLTGEARKGLPADDLKNKNAYKLISNDGNIVVAHKNSGRLWDLETGNVAGKAFQLLNEIEHISFSCDRRKMVSTGYYDPLVRIWDMNDGRLIHKIDASSGSVQNIHEPEFFEHIIFTPSGEEVLTASSYGAIRLWDVNTGRLIRDFRNPSSHIASVAFSSNGRLLATGHYEVARLWDVPSGHLIQEFRGHSSFEEIESVVFSPDGRYFFTSGQDGVFRWPIPELPNDPERVRSWVEVRSVAKWDDKGFISSISRDEWYRQWVRLTELGGPFETLGVGASR